MLSIDNGIADGSARSVANYHLLNALESCSGLFEQFGGHAVAAGMKIKSENIEQLRQALDRHASENIPTEDLVPTLKIDAVVTPSTMNLDLVDELGRLEPFGAGNPKPVFITKGLVITAEPLVMKDKHLKLNLSEPGGKRFEAVWWDGVIRSKGQTLKPKSCIELAYVPEVNTWQGNRRLQLVVEGIRADNYDGGKPN